MSDAIENTTGSADSNDKTKLIGRESDVVPGRFGEPLQITHVQYSRGGGSTAPKRPLFLCLHGWGSNEADLADMMRYVAPYNDFASLRAPLTLQPAGRFAPGAYSWLHDCVDTGEDLDRDAFAAAKAIDDWVSANIPDDRAVVPIGFSQGGLLAIHLLRVHPERYAATISLSGFLAPGTVAGTAPADDRVAELNIPTFFGYGKNDTVIPMPELFATAAWLDEHTFLTEKSYRPPHCSARRPCWPAPVSRLTVWCRCCAPRPSAAKPMTMPSPSGIRRPPTWLRPGRLWPGTS